MANRKPNLTTRFPRPQGEYQRADIDDLVRTLERMTNDLAAPEADGWSVSAFTSMRTFTASTASLGDVNNTFATLLDDLLASGRLRG